VAAEAVPDPASAAAEAESVRLASPADRPALVSSLAAAFRDDPVLEWFQPDDAERHARLPGLFGFMGENVWFRQELTHTTDGCVGGALWMRPGEWKVSLLDQLRLTPGFVRTIGLRRLPRALRGFNFLEAKHPEDPPHYYLAVLGVAPEWQGKGLGTALMQPVLDQCDREGAKAFLEATTPRSRACYERAGFETTAELSFPADGPTIWQMWREPR
jgi:GNAT superfamily N-acetyltransferase